MGKRIKLAYVCPWFSSEYRGPLYNVLEELSKYVDVVCVCSRQKYVQYFQRHEKYKKRIEWINPHFKIHRFESVAPRDVVFPLNLTTILEEEQPDIIQSDEYFRFTSLQAFTYARKNGVPFILNSRMRRREGVVRNLFLWIMKFLACDMVKNSQLIVAIGEEAKKEFLRWFPSAEPKVVVLPTGINPTKFRGISRVDGKRFRDKFGIPHHKKIILNVGRIYPVKRIDLLLYIWKIVKKRAGDAVLVVVGPADPQEKVKVEKLIRKLGLVVGEDVFFTGPIPNEKIGMAYASAEVFVNTSETEGICYSFLEAMCFKLPIVAFKVGGNYEVVEDCVNGYLVKFGDVDAFADKVVNLLRDEKLRERMGRNALKILKKKFYLPKLCKREVALLREVLNRISSRQGYIS